jgi:hypothetical protein
MVPSELNLCAIIASLGAKRRKRGQADRLFSWAYMRQNAGESYAPTREVLCQHDAAI